MKVTILGCGTSVGVPALGSIGWGKCDSRNPLNNRQRSSVLVQKNGKNILIDCGPDIRNQLLKTNINKIDAVLLTHAHSDHIMGLPDLRPYFWPDKQKIPIYTNSDTLNNVFHSFEFLFIKQKHSPDYFSPPLDIFEIKNNEIQLGGFDIQVFNQNHGNIDTLGFIFDKTFAYSTDVVKIPEENFSKLKNLDLWILDSLRKEPHESHAHFELSFEWIKKSKPKMAVLTHLSWETDYNELASICPKNVYPAYDGMEIQI